MSIIPSIKMKEVCWGMIGCGDVTEIKSGPAFNKIKNSRLVAVMRRDKEKAASYAQRHGIEKWYTQADDLLNDPEINAVYIATPPDSHAEYTIKALKKGFPVYCEKPMALTHLQCIQMINASKKFQKPLFVAYYRRMLPEFLRIKELIDKGSIGEPRLVSCTLLCKAREADFQKDKLPWRVLPELSGGGYFFDMAPHQLDLLEYFLGEINQVQSIVTNQARLYPAEDTLSATFSFKSGVVGSGIWSFVTHEKLQQDIMEITGTHGKISFSCFDNAPVVLTTPEGTKKFRFKRPVHIQQPFIESIVKELTTGKQCPADKESAARTNLILEKIVKPFYE